MYYLFFWSRSVWAFLESQFPLSVPIFCFLKKKNKKISTTIGAKRKLITFLVTKKPDKIAGFKINQVFTPSEYPSIKFLHQKKK